MYVHRKALRCYSAYITPKVYKYEYERRVVAGYRVRCCTHHYERANLEVISRVLFAHVITRRKKSLQILTNPLILAFIVRFSR